MSQPTSFEVDDPKPREENPPPPQTPKFPEVSIVGKDIHMFFMARICTHAEFTLVLSNDGVQLNSSEIASMV